MGIAPHVHTIASTAILYKMDYKKLLTRTASGIIYCGIIIGAIFCGIYGVAILAALLSSLACMEFDKISHRNGSGRTLLLLTDITACLLLSFTPIAPLLGFGWLFAILIRIIEQLYLIEEDPVNDLAHSMLVQAWIALPMFMMTFIAGLWQPMVILAIFLFLWINDTGAYLVGSTFGKHRLFERISPKKSWEGFIGGFVFNLAFAVLFYFTGGHFFGIPEASIWIWFGLATTVTIFGTWGDLVESMIKRTLHIKDSGNLIPGHGGILDRIDSLLLAVPATFIYLSIWEILR